MGPGSDAPSKFRLAAGWLLVRGWARDGDDLGVWIPPAGCDLGPQAFGVAFQLQLERDGVSMLDEIASDAA